MEKRPADRRGQSDRPSLREGRVTVKRNPTRTNSTTRATTAGQIAELQDNYSRLERYIKDTEHIEGEEWFALNERISQLEREVSHMYWYILAPILVLIVVAGSMILRPILERLAGH